MEPDYIYIYYNYMLIKYFKPCFAQTMHVFSRAQAHIHIINNACSLYTRRLTEINADKF